MTRPSPNRITLLWVAGAVVLTSPLFVLFKLLDHPGNGRAAWFTAFTIVLATKVRWELSRNGWFWATIAAIVLCHVPFVLFVPWTAQWVPSFVIMPFCVIDGIAILAIIQGVEKRMSPAQSSDTAS
jgi:hypothetical protein